jgi:hypothetical protein
MGPRGPRGQAGGGINGRATMVAGERPPRLRHQRTAAMAAGEPVADGSQEASTASGRWQQRVGGHGGGRAGGSEQATALAAASTDVRSSWRPRQPWRRGRWTSWEAMEAGDLGHGCSSGCLTSSRQSIFAPSLSCFAKSLPRLPRLLENELDVHSDRRKPFLLLHIAIVVSVILANEFWRSTVIFEIRVHKGFFRSMKG